MQYFQYFPIESALKYLNTDRLKVSIPNSINDPFEFLPNFIKTKDENILRQQVLKDNIAQLLISKFSKDINFVKTYGSMTIDRWPVVVQNDWKNIMLLYQSNSDSYFQGVFQDLLDEISLLKGLICFSSKNDSILMWSHYAEGHTAIVIEFGQFPLWNKIQKVKYSKKRIPVRFGFEIVDLNEFSEVFFTKNISWKYEQELRLEINLSECIKSEKDYYIHVPKTVIKSIYFGLKTTDDSIIKIKNIGNQNISFFKAVHNYSHYKIDFMVQS